MIAEIINQFFTPFIFGYLDAQFDHWGININNCEAKGYCNKICINQIKVYVYFKKIPNASKLKLKTKDFLILETQTFFFLNFFDSRNSPITVNCAENSAFVLKYDLIW